MERASVKGTPNGLFACGEYGHDFTGHASCTCRWAPSDTALTCGALARVQKYAYAKATGTVEVYTGLPIQGLNPLSLEIVKVEGRLLLGPKCPCKPTKEDLCPTKCKKTKSKKKKPRVGGHVMVLGVILKRFGKLQLGEPYDPRNDLAGAEVPAILPSGIDYGDPDIDDPPRSGADTVGFCKFDRDDFERKTFLNTKHYPIDGVDGAYYWLGKLISIPDKSCLGLDLHTAFHT